MNKILYMLCIVFVFAGCGPDEGEESLNHNPQHPNFRHNPNDWVRDNGDKNKQRNNPWDTQIPPDLPHQNNLWDMMVPSNPVMPHIDSGGIFKVYKGNEIKQTFADVAGLEESKKALATIVDYLKDPIAFKRLGAEPPTGVLFYGPPGTGKTEIARAFAGEVAKTRKVSFIVASGASFENKFVGVGADNVRKLFRLARSNLPAIIFIDEFDAVAGTRSDEKKNAQVVNQLLTELDGFNKEDRDQIFIIAATNLLDSIDPAVIRPGRIDRKIEIGLPNDDARRAILEHYMALAPAITGINIRNLVTATRSWSVAEIKTLVNEARIHATSTNAASVSNSDFAAALLLVKKSRRNP